MRWLRLVLLASLMSALGLVACGDSPTDPSGTSGNFRLLLTDGPFTDALAALVTFSSVSVHRDGDGGFTTLPLDGGERTCDLKKLQGAQDVPRRRHPSRRELHAGAPDGFARRDLFRQRLRRDLDGDRSIHATGNGP